MAKVIDYQSIKPADQCRYDAVSLGEVMLRLDQEMFQRHGYAIISESHREAEKPTLPAD